MPEEYYCERCDGTDITTSTHADCRWDVVKQDFVEFSLYDEGTDYCNTCKGESDCYWREVTDVKTLAKIAIHKGDNHDRTSN